VIRSRKIPSRLIMFMAFAGMSAINYAFGLAAGWLLLPGDFGLLAFAQTLLTIAGLVLNSGFVWSLTAALVDSSAARRAALVRGAVVANLLLALVMSAVLILLFQMGWLRAGLESWAVTAIVAGTLPVLSIVAIARAAAQGCEHFSALAVLLVVETIIKAGAGIGLVLAGYGALGAVAGFLLGALGTALLGVIYLIRILHVRLWGSLERPELRTAGALFGALLGMALLLNLDTISMKLLLPGDRAAVGRYQAGIVLANMPYYLLTATIPVLFTQIARIKIIGRTGPIVADSLRLALLVLLPIEALLAAFPGLFLSTLFPPAYLAGATTLRILAVANAAIILVAVFSTAFQATGRPSIAGRLLLGIAACESIVLWAVVPVWHGVGAAYTFLGATLISLILLGAAYCARLDALPLGLLFSWLARYGLAILAAVTTCTLVLWASGSSPLAVGFAAATYVIAMFGLRLASVRGFLSRPPSAQPMTVAGGQVTGDK
jgi:O-antigen/teichoic acid export membrane protein